MAVFIPSIPLFAYPDLVAVSGQPQSQDGESEVILNPSLIVEVHSPSTEAYDRGLKFHQYQTIESLEEYLLVATDRIHADLFTRRTDKSWLLTSFDGPEGRIELSSIGGHARLSNIYQKVTLEIPRDGRPH